MTDAPILTGDLLAELEAALGQQDPELVARLAPGLDDQDIDELMRPRGLTLPEEARVWWRWHDGLTWSTVDGRIFGPGFQLLPLEAAVREYTSRLEQAEELAKEIPNITFWERPWFPLVGAGTGLFIFDCSGDPAAPAPISFYHVEEAGEDGRPPARSVGEMVAWWIDALERGVWYYDRELGGWGYRRDLLDRDRRLSQLV